MHQCHIPVRLAVLAFVSTLAPCVAARAQSPGAATLPAFDAQLTRTEKTFVAAADAMPADQYAFVPTTGAYAGVRTFGQQVKHVAAANYFFFAAILHEKPPVDLGPNGEGPATTTSKADLMEFLRGSFVYGHHAMQSITAANLEQPVNGGGMKDTVAGFAIGGIAHTWDIYGQVVEYLRLNRIVPPASRGK